MKAINPTALLLCMAMAITSQAQKIVSYQHGSTNKTTIAGTSTLHDWTMTSTEGTYDAKFEINQEGAATQLLALTYNLRAESLKSGKNAMDKNAYNALNTEKHKKISFVLTTAATEDSKIKASGNLTIAGVTKTIPVEATCKNSPNGELTCTAKATMKMTDYKVEPPTFMFGSIKTGDEITLTFSITLSPTKL